MTDPALIAAASVTVISALAAATVTIVNAIAAARDRRDSSDERRVLYEKAILSAKSQDDTSHKADILIEKATEIHTLTNSSNAELQKALALMTEKYQGIQTLVAEMEKAKQEAIVTKTATDLTAALLLRPPGDRREGDK